ncbi:hypothetical protein ACFL2A_04745 [Thermodesulfobacteriota bacterium]
MSFNPNCMAIAIGSMPNSDINKALDIVLKYLPEAPIWPQLPKLSFNESMTAQYTEGMPCIKIDGEHSRVYVDTTSDDYLDEVSEKLGLALDGQYEEFKISEDFAHGFYALMERLKVDFVSSIQILKGHVIGPLSLGLSLHDPSGKSIIYDDNLKDAMINALAMKAKWQEQEFLKLGKDVKTMIFFDEPSLTQIGTPFVSISKDEAVEILNTCLDAVDGIKGIHVCGNTDWSLVTSTKTDIINFDAYTYPQSLSLYPGEISDFLDRGGMIAWGVTPSTEEIVGETAETIFAKFEAAVDLLSETGIDKKRILTRSFVSPSCGTGSLTEELSERVFKCNHDVSKLIRAKYF